MKSLIVIIVAALPFTTSGASAEPPFIGGLARPEQVSPRISGAVLISELSCAACHATPRADLAAKLGPDLSAIGARAHGAHLREFIANPAATKPGTTMPAVLGHLPTADRKSTRLNSSHSGESRMPSAA